MSEVIYPKVGVCLPVYNAYDFLENCINSLNAQIYPVTIYIVDDVSTDYSYRWLNDRRRYHLSGHHLVRNTRNMGWPYSLNKAVSMAIEDRCNFVFPMNADDWLRLDCISKMIDVIGSWDWVSCYGQQINGRNVVMEVKEDATLEDFLDHTVLTNWALIRPEAWQAVGGYSLDVSLPGLNAGFEDWEFWIKMLKAGFIYKVVKEPLYYYRMHDDQLHLKTTARSEEARRIILRKHGLLE